MVYILRMRTKYTKNRDVCHWKDETSVFQFVLDAPPPLDDLWTMIVLGFDPLDPRCPLDNAMSL